jgi:UDP-hydrolysing UDP-N-acetyl-D-glucosamine 2-epimerase
MKRRITVVTSSRAEYSHLYWVLKELAGDERVDLRIVAMGAHLSPEYGTTARSIVEDGFTVEESVECLLSSDSDVGMAKSLAVAMLGLTEHLSRLRPDLLLLIADRYEMLAPACVALTLRIPMAHIEGGEISEGAIDDAVRNALTKMAHVHFTSTETARRRVIAMGEESWRVHCTGAPSLDHLRRSVLLSKVELAAALDLSLEGRVTVVAYHPVTLLRETTAEADEVFKALEEVEGTIVFCYPNADAGSHRLMELARAFCRKRGHAKVFVNLPAATYFSLLREAWVLVGNSSSGIMEAASLGLPAVNVGLRQYGRERAMNLLDAEPDASSIRAQLAKASNAEFRETLRGMKNPYGDGEAAGRIASVLASVPLEELLRKRAVMMPVDGGLG